MTESDKNQSERDPHEDDLIQLHGVLESIQAGVSKVASEIAKSGEEGATEIDELHRLGRQLGDAQKRVIKRQAHIANLNKPIEHFNIAFAQMEKLKSDIKKCQSARKDLKFQNHKLQVKIGVGKGLITFVKAGISTRNFVVADNWMSRVGLPVLGIVIGVAATWYFGIRGVRDAEAIQGTVEEFKEETDEKLDRMKGDINVHELEIDLIKAGLKPESEYWEFAQKGEWSSLSQTAHSRLRKATSSVDSARSLSAEGLGAFGEEDFEGAETLWASSYELGEDAYQLVLIGGSRLTRALDSTVVDKQPLLDSALDVLDSAIENNPLLADAYVTRGLTKHYLGDDREAATMFSKADSLESWRDSEAKHWQLIPEVIRSEFQSRQIGRVD